MSILGRLTYSSVVGVNLSFFKNINLEFWFLVFIFVGRKIVFWFIESLNLLSRFLSPPPVMMQGERGNCSYGIFS